MTEFYRSFSENMEEQTRGRSRTPLTSKEKIKRFRERKREQDPDFDMRESKRIEALRKKKVQSMSSRQHTAQVPKKDNKKQGA